MKKKTIKKRKNKPVGKDPRKKAKKTEKKGFFNSSKKSKAKISRKTSKSKTKANRKKGNIKRTDEIQRILYRPVNIGNFKPEKERIVVLVVSIIFVLSGMLILNTVRKEEPKSIPVVKHAPFKKASALENEIKNMVQGYPIEEMTPYIAEKNPKTAAFLVAIAKKESNWGKRKPVLNGEDCYNYWGFRLKSDRMGSGGHTCFDTPKEAVDIVSTRIDELVKEEKIDTPQEMVVWKCGSDCSITGGQKSANKWISDVGYYYNKFSKYL